MSGLNTPWWDDMEGPQDSAGNEIVVTNLISRAKSMCLKSLHPHMAKGAFDSYLELECLIGYEYAPGISAALFEAGVVHSPKGRLN